MGALRWVNKSPNRLQIVTVDMQRDTHVYIACNLTNFIGQPA